MFDESGAHLYYLDTQAGTSTKAFDVNTLLPGGLTQIFEIRARSSGESLA